MFDIKYDKENQIQSQKRMIKFVKKIQRFQSIKLMFLFMDLKKYSFGIGFSSFDINSFSYKLFIKYSN